jgi:hypothetical protein
MQFHPFFDPQAIDMLNEFEHAVYATVGNVGGTAA